MKVLITGGAGFIGSHLVEHYLKNSDWELVILDKLAYAANGMSRLRDVRAFDQQKNRVQLYVVDISHPFSPGIEQEIGSVDYILHLAAETDVNRSIEDPRPFVQSNVVGTMEMLQLARRMGSRLKAFVQMSTDEVFGPCFNGAPSFKEMARYNSTNPYSATKAAAEELCMAWANTFGVPMIVVHSMNAFGERQHPEKYIPLVVRKILRSEKIMVHSDPTRTSAGSRHYIHARNIADAMKFIVENVKPGIGMKLREKLNFVGEKEVDNLELAKLIHKLMSEVINPIPELKVELVDFHSSRPGHDLRYALNGEKLKLLGWEPPKNFEESLRKTIQWMVEPANLHWLMI